MIAKITFGSSGRGLIRYLFGPGQANEHTDQRVITSGLELGGDALAGGYLSSEQIADIGAGLDAAHEEFGTNPRGGHILHVSLSLPPGDRQLSDDQWAQIADKAMEHWAWRVKEGNPRPGSRWGTGRVPTATSTSTWRHPWFGSTAAG
jgi:hypothetical protein